MNAQAHGINTSAYWDSGAVAAKQFANADACVNQKRPMNWLYCCFVTSISTKARHWTCYGACTLFVDVETFRLTVLRPRLRHHWHCCICSYCHNINQLRLAPSIPWMHYSYSIGFFCSVVSIDKFIKRIKLHWDVSWGQEKIKKGKNSYIIAS